ncbi:hypothetical protein BJX64DRAFT_257535 [Aspergillus heterothallicus]
MHSVRCSPARWARQSGTCYLTAILWRRIMTSSSVARDLHWAHCFGVTDNNAHRRFRELVSILLAWYSLSDPPGGGNGQDVLDRGRWLYIVVSKLGCPTSAVPMSLPGSDCSSMEAIVHNPIVLEIVDVACLTGTRISCQATFQPATSWFFRSKLSGYIRDTDQNLELLSRSCAYHLAQIDYGACRNPC